MSAEQAMQAPGWVHPVAVTDLDRERVARIAARRNFVAVKSSLLQVTADLAGPGADSLRYKLRRADAAVELWLLRHQVFDALPARGHHTAALRLDLARRLEAVFVDSVIGS